MTETYLLTTTKENNKLYIKREDLIPFSFGGNKARKAKLFFQEIEKGHYDTVVTYGSSSSNHARVVANYCRSKGYKCIIISPKESSKETFNLDMMKMLNAEIITVSVDQVSTTIEEVIHSLKEKGYSPYFIEGGGHGNIGTQAYVDCFNEIVEYEKNNTIKFDYIFLASGTGTTQAGLVCGKLINHHSTEVVGISIARKNPRGQQVVKESIISYLGTNSIDVDMLQIENALNFTDEYIGQGYGSFDDSVIKTIEKVFVEYGVPLDSTYTGKAFDGMVKYINSNNIVDKNILFLHTGGTPLFFDFLKGRQND